jgi:hypothetical protein
LNLKLAFGPQSERPNDHGVCRHLPPRSLFHL